MNTRARVVLAKVGLDGHDVGVSLVAKALVGAGYEVVYLGKRVPTAHIVATALAEDADAIGISCLSGGLAHFAGRVLGELREQGAVIPVIAGGIDEPDQIERMRQEGVYAYFGPGTDIGAAVSAFDEAIAASSDAIHESAHGPRR